MVSEGEKRKHQFHLLLPFEAEAVHVNILELPPGSFGTPTGSSAPKQPLPEPTRLFASPLGRNASTCCSLASSKSLERGEIGRGAAAGTAWTSVEDIPVPVQGLYAYSFVLQVDGTRRFPWKIDKKKGHLKKIDGKGSWRSWVGLGKGEGWETDIRVLEQHDGGRAEAHEPCFRDSHSTRDSTPAQGAAAVPAVRLQHHIDTLSLEELRNWKESPPWLCNTFPRFCAWHCGADGQGSGFGTHALVLPLTSAAFELVKYRCCLEACVRHSTENVRHVLEWRGLGPHAVCHSALESGKGLGPGGVGSLTSGTSAHQDSALSCQGRVLLLATALYVTTAAWDAVPIGVRDLVLRDVCDLLPLYQCCLTVGCGTFPACQGLLRLYRLGSGSWCPAPRSALLHGSPIFQPSASLTPHRRFCRRSSNGKGHQHSARRRGRVSGQQIIGVLFWPQQHGCQAPRCS